ncbi:MAG: glycosyltransferase [Actinobacteria bacterium]|nr:glycosyltransferase [Actinomycetota bacterium]
MDFSFSFPNVSIIVVNYNGKKYLKDCLDSINLLDYPKERVETIVIDNGSTDSSVEFIKESYPKVKIIENDKNIGFAPAVNQGAKTAGGKYIAILNNDTRVDSKWLIELIKPIYEYNQVVCTGSKVLSWDGKKIDFVGSMVNFEGKGFQIDYGFPIEHDKYTEDKYYLFVNGSSMLVDKEVFLNVGGFDEDFFAYYEDVDFGWRLWILGYKVVFTPKSIVYHHHHGTSYRYGHDRHRYLMERNSLYTVYKNYSDENLGKIFSSSLLTQLSRVFVETELSSDSYKINYKGDVKEKEELSRLSGSSLLATKEFIQNLDKLKQKREWIQANRKRSDNVIFNYFKGEFLAISPNEEYQKNQQQILKAFDVYDIFQKSKRKTILILSNDIVAKKLAGPGIRCINFAEVLSEYFNVIIAILNEPDFEPDQYELIKVDSKNIEQLVERADIIMTQGTQFIRYPLLKETDKPIIMDLYDPFNIATLVEYSHLSIREWEKVYKSVHNDLKKQLYYGDFFTCASERQRDYWLGLLTALYRVNPIVFKNDISLRRLIDVVPYGISSKKPFHSKKVLKGVIGNIKDTDKVIMWGGGIYNWYDPLTLVYAINKISKKRDDIKLYIMGVKHPNPDVKELSLLNETFQLSKSLKLKDKFIFFYEGWVEYRERQNYLLESDIGIITHPDHIETRLCFRNRILDYIWTNLPIISTKGDILSAMVEEKELGLTVDAGDVDGLVNAIEELCDNHQLIKKCKENLERVVPTFYWEEVVKPLIDYCNDPIKTAYRKEAEEKKVREKKLELEGVLLMKEGSEKGLQRKGLYYYIKRFLYHLRYSGLRKAIQFTKNILSKK